MNVFLDTSALVKRYVEEPGSDAVAEILAGAEGLVVSSLCLPECVSAFRRLARDGHMSDEDYEELKGHLLGDLSDAVICHVVPNVLELAVDHLERHPLRTLDALQLACARAALPDLFVTADRKQGEAARAEGLAVRDV